MVLRKTGCDKIMLDLTLSYILMRTRGPYDCSWTWENIGSLFFIYKCDFCILGLTTVQSLCCWIFAKSKGLILIEK